MIISTPGCTNDELQIYHHLGLGDHIICNGLVRQFSKLYQKVYCFVKAVNVSSVAFMYRDEPKIQLIPVKDDSEVVLRTNESIPLIKIGFEKLDTSSGNFDESFYRQVGMDFSSRWYDFYVERDHQLERELFSTLNPGHTPYALVHDDVRRSLFLDVTYVTKGLQIINPSEHLRIQEMNPEFQNYNLFHWILLLENAEEIHCMDSSFKCLVESLSNLAKPRLYYHRYVRGSGPRAVSTVRKNWTVIKRGGVPFIARNLIYRIRHKLLTELSAATNCFSRQAPIFLKTAVIKGVDVEIKDSTENM